MHLSDRLLGKVLSTPSKGDADEIVKAMASEIRLLRKEIAQLRQTFVPLSGNLDPRTAKFFLALNDLCMATKVRAAGVVPYTSPDGMLLLHVAGETNIAELVRGLLPNVEA